MRSEHDSRQSTWGGYRLLSTANWPNGGIVCVHQVRIQHVGNHVHRPTETSSVTQRIGDISDGNRHVSKYHQYNDPLKIDAVSPYIHIQCVRYPAHTESLHFVSSHRLSNNTMTRQLPHDYNVCISNPTQSQFNAT